MTGKLAVKTNSLLPEVTRPYDVINQKTGIPHAIEAFVGVQTSQTGYKDVTPLLEGE
jgi:hypothetical protein